MFIHSLSSKFKVQSSRSARRCARPEFRAAQFRLLKILDEAGNQTTCLGRHVVKLVKLRLSHILLVKSSVKLITNFTAGTFGTTQKLDELAIAATFESFRDV